MRVKGIIEEDFTNFKFPSMFINTCFCDFKCCTESGLGIEVCQNAPLAQAATRDIQNSVIYQHFVNNPITKAIVLGGMEPFMQFDEVVDLIHMFRENGCLSDFIIYTGYYPDEIKDKIKDLKLFKNIIIKFGRYIPNRPSKYDEVLGITLVSDNQYAERIS